MLFRQPGPPLYFQLADFLRRRIESGNLAPGQMLPSLHELAAIYNVARVTARQAVQLLVGEGLLESRQGRGTCVSARLPLKTYQNMRTSWDDMSRRFEGATVEMLELGEVDNCPLLEPGGPPPVAQYHYMKRVHIKENVRFAYIDLYLDSRIFALDPERFSNTTVIPVMGEMGIKVASARQLLTIDVADPDIAHRLHLNVGAPVARILRIALDASGCAIYAAHVVHPGDRVKFDIDLVP